MTIKLTPELSSVELGERLKVARETANVTQDAAAKAAEIARTTLVAIEKGQRSVRIEELQALSPCYGVSVNSLLRREAVHVDLVPRFRSLPETSDVGIERAARTLNDLVRAEVELENILGVQRVNSYSIEKKFSLATCAYRQSKMHRASEVGLGSVSDQFKACSRSWSFNSVSECIAASLIPRCRGSSHMTMRSALAF
jgi:DNA-binding XRE family transcriptional regulator